MNSQLSKIRSVHRYVIPRTVYFGLICNIEKMSNFSSWFLTFESGSLSCNDLIFYSRMFHLTENIMNKKIQIIIPICKFCF